MWGSLEDNGELRRVVLKGWGLDGSKVEIKHESGGSQRGFSAFMR